MFKLNDIIKTSCCQGTMHSSCYAIIALVTDLLHTLPYTEDPLYNDTVCYQRFCC